MEKWYFVFGFDSVFNHKYFVLEGEENECREKAFNEFSCISSVMSEDEFYRSRLGQDRGYTEIKLEVA